MIQIDDLTKNYGSFHLRVSMKIPDGRVTGLVGRNGAGKTTVIKSLLGLVTPDSGRVMVLGKDASYLTASDKEQIGVSFSDSGFSTYLNLKDLVSILKNSYSEFDQDWFLEACRKANLPMNVKLQKFSTGMKARLKLLAAVSHKAKLLILDEPTAGLDVIARNEVLDMLRDYLAEDESRTVLISSHISSDLEGICDDIYMLMDGRIVFHEDTDVIMGEYAMLKLTKEDYRRIDKQYILKTRQESFGVSCLTDQKQFYADNYPDIVIESGKIDDLITITACPISSACR